MRTTSKFVKSLAVLSTLLPLCTSGLASIVYDNSSTDLNRIQPATNNVEFGDEVTLAGTDRIVNDVKFEYFLSQNANGNEKLQLTLYANDGPAIVRTLPDGSTISVPTPNTVLYTSPILDPLGLSFQTAEVSQFEVAVPNSFTWAVTFQGIDAGEVAGLRVFDPPTTGSSFGDFWAKNNGTWNTYLFSDGVAANFGARISAIPEPTTLAYALLAGLSCFGYFGYRRRSS
jgi:hypothetical protein